MSLAFIGNYEIGNLILKYDTTTGIHEEIKFEDLPENTKKRGFYIRNKQDLIGFYPSHHGPILFVNERRFPMKDAHLKLELISGETENKFIIFCQDEEIHLKYEPKTDKYWDSWSTTDEDVDLFIWLKNNLNSPNFYSFNTI